MNIPRPLTQGGLAPYANVNPTYRHAIAHEPQRSSHDDDHRLHARHHRVRGLVLRLQPGGLITRATCRCVRNNSDDNSPKSTEAVKPLAVPYADVFIAAGERHGVSPYLLAAQARQESINFNPDVVACRRDSPAGARGISQFMPATAKSWGVDPCNVESAIDGQARFMQALIKKFDGRIDLALAAYNSGPARVERLQRIPRIRETQDYVRIVLAGEKELLGS